MNEEKIRRIVTLIVVIFAGNMLMGILFFGKEFDALGGALNLHSMRVKNPVEYHGYFVGYDHRLITATDGDGYYQDYAIVEYQTEDGIKKTVKSKLTNQDRGGKLPEDIIVLDNGTKAALQPDIDASRHNLLIGLISIAVRIAFIAGAVTVFLIREKQMQKQEQNPTP